MLSAFSYFSTIGMYPVYNEKVTKIKTHTCDFPLGIRNFLSHSSFRQLLPDPVLVSHLPRLSFLFSLCKMDVIISASSHPKTFVCCSYLLLIKPQVNANYYYY